MLLILLDMLFEQSPKNYASAKFSDSAFSASHALHFNACLRQKAHATSRF